MRRCWIVIALLAGCDATAPSCDDVASELAHFAPRSSRASASAAIGGACEREAWPAEARRCLKWVERRSRVHTCSSQLSEKQTDWLTKQLDPDLEHDLDALKNEDPPPPPPEPPPEHETLTIDIGADGTTSFGGRPMSGDELDALFKTTVGVDPQAKVVLRVAATTKYDSIMPAMDRAQRAGLHDVSFETK